jgi:hypothetical protein
MDSVSRKIAASFFFSSFLAILKYYIRILRNLVYIPYREVEQSGARE